MSEHRAFSKDTMAPRRLKGEWVPTERGDVYVREMRTREYLQLSSKAQRPSIDPRGGIDATEAVLWQVALCCYPDDDPNAAPLFNLDDPGDLQILFGLSQEEFISLLAAINRVNGRDPTEEELRRDFSAARQGANSLPFTPSASSD